VWLLEVLGSSRQAVVDPLDAGLETGVLGQVAPEGGRKSASEGVTTIWPPFAAEAIRGVC
jgi:hypothetical protein